MAEHDVTEPAAPAAERPEQPQPGSGPHAGSPVTADRAQGPTGERPAGDDVATCRICGCTEERACEGGCSWIQDPQHVGDLCSSCLPFVRAVLDVVRADLRPVIDALLREQYNSGHLGDTLAELLEAWDVG